MLLTSSLLAALMFAGDVTEQSQLPEPSLIGKHPPELVYQKEHWLGGTAPLTLAELKGKVVWLQFHF